MNNEECGDLVQQINETREISQHLLKNAGLPREVRGKRAAFVYFNGGYCSQVIEGLEIKNYTVCSRKAGIKKEAYVELVTSHCVLEGSPVTCFKVTTGEEPLPVLPNNIFKCICATAKGITVGYLVLSD